MTLFAFIIILRYLFYLLLLLLCIRFDYFPNIQSKRCWINTKRWAKRWTSMDMLFNIIFILMNWFFFPNINILFLIYFLYLIFVLLIFFSINFFIYFTLFLFINLNLFIYFSKVLHFASPNILPPTPLIPIILIFLIFFFLFLMFTPGIL